MTTRLFNPGPSPFVSPEGGVFGPGEHFDAELNDALYGAVDRGRLLVVDVPEVPQLPPAGPDDVVLQPVVDDDLPDDVAATLTDGEDEITEVGSEDEIVIDETTTAPKPGPPAKKTTSKNEKD